MRQLLKVQLNTFQDSLKKFSRHLQEFQYFFKNIQEFQDYFNYFRNLVQLCTNIKLVSYLMTLYTLLIHPCYLFFSEFLVGDLQDMTVDLQGLGLLNWVVKKVILGVVEQNISTILVTRGKELFRKEISEVSLIDQMYTTFNIL